MATILPGPLRTVICPQQNIRYPVNAEGATFTVEGTLLGVCVWVAVTKCWECVHP